MRTDKKIRKEAKISLKLLTYFISSFVYFVVVDVVFFSAVLSLFCMCNDVIFLSDDGRRRRRLHHSRCSSLALFFQFFLFYFVFSFWMHISSSRNCKQTHPQNIHHAHLSIIRNDHSINTTLATNQPSIINANRFLCDEGLFLNFKLHVPSLTSTTAEILMS